MKASDKIATMWLERRASIERIAIYNKTISQLFSWALPYIKPGKEKMFFANLPDFMAGILDQLRENSSRHDFSIDKYYDLYVPPRFKNYNDDVKLNVPYAFSAVLWMEVSYRDIIEASLFDTKNFLSDIRGFQKDFLIHLSKNKMFQRMFIKYLDDSVKDFIRSMDDGDWSDITKYDQKEDFEYYLDDRDVDEFAIEIGDVEIEDIKADSPRIDMDNDSLSVAVDFEGEFNYREIYSDWEDTDDHYDEDNFRPERY